MIQPYHSGPRFLTDERDVRLSVTQRPRQWESAASHCVGWKQRQMIDSKRIAGVVKTLPGRAGSFFHRRCLVGFPWFWPSQPLGDQAMVHARRIVRRHYARDHHPIHRALARVLVTAVWPFAVLINLWEIRHSRGPEAAPIKRLPRAFWSAI